MNTPILHVQNLTAGYGAKKVIHDVNFSVAQGGIVGIIGPNGAGKTTLFRVITRLIKPMAGEVRYCGKDTVRMAARELAKAIAVLPQALALGFDFTVADFVRMGRLPHIGRWQSLQEKDIRIAEEMMRMTEVNGLAGSGITELSGGELQRVLLAQALTQEPELLLLDEPTSHLDIGHQVEIMDLVRKLNREKNLTTIMVLHDLNLAGLYCDELILLSEGKIFAKGAPAEVLTYQNIEAVYKTVVVVKENPITKSPHILLVPKDKWNR